MAVSKALRRLLRVLDLEEEQRRIALESAQGQLGLLERALEAARRRERGGRRLIADSTRNGDRDDRLAGIAEVRAGERRSAVLEARIARAEMEVAARRQEFLDKRVERRQTEVLIRASEAREAIAAGRRGQRALDDWYLSRLRRSGDSSDAGKEDSPRHSLEEAEGI